MAARAKRTSSTGYPSAGPTASSWLAALRETLGDSASAFLGHAGHFRSAEGNAVLTTVDFPGVLCTSNHPPTREMMSLLIASPRPW